MSYEKQNWQTGDVVTSNKLNHMEDGIGGAGGMIVTATYEDYVYTLDKTYNEIKAHLLSGGVPLFKTIATGEGATEYTFAPILGFGEGDGMYFVALEELYTTDDPDGYPTYDSK